MLNPFKVGDKVDRVGNLEIWKKHTKASPTGLTVSRITGNTFIQVEGIDGDFLVDHFEYHYVQPVDPQPVTNQPEYTGGSVDYYKVPIVNPTTPYALGYTAECNDIIEALGMNYAEGNAFKAIWRRAAQRTLGKRKAGAKDDGLYDAEKVEFFGKRLVEQSKAARDAKDPK